GCAAIRRGGSRARRWLRSCAQYRGEPETGVGSAAARSQILERRGMACTRRCGNDRRGGSAAQLALLSFAMLIVSLDQYIVVVALPDIGRELGYSSQTLQSVISTYAVASGGFLLFGGRAADLLGPRRMLVTGLLLYAVASLAGGLASGAVVQLTARGVQ